MNRFFKVFRRIDMHTTTATTEDDMMKACSLSKHPTAKLSNHQTVLGHAEAQRGRGAEMDFCAKEQKVEAAMSNHQTTKLPNHQTILRQMGRWAAVAAVAAGAWLESARDAEIAA